MTRTPKLCRIGAILLALSLPGTVLARQKHPGYSRATDDLRTARALLQRTSGPEAPTDEVSMALGHIDEALVEINQAIGAKGKNPRSLPRVVARMPWTDRVSMSLRMLERAQQECASEKDNGGSDGLRARVLDELASAHSPLLIENQTVNFDYDARNLPTRND